MSEPLANVVDQTIDWVIRSFRPDDSGTLKECETELQRVEELLLAEPGPATPDLLAQIRAVRISLAGDIGDFQAVLRESESFLKTCPPARLDFFNVVTLRLRALHAIGNHSDEIREGLELAKRPQIGAEDLVLLLEGLVKRHPRSLEPAVFLREKLMDALQQLALKGYTNLPTIEEASENLERTVLQTATEFRRVNRARAAAVLAENDGQ